MANFIIGDVVGSIVRFPFWWYTDGVMSVVRWLGRSLSYRWRGYAIGLWVRHLFVPMYGAYDWASRLISFVMRVMVIAIRLFAFLMEALASLALLIAWFFLPVICLLFLLLNLSMGLNALWPS